MTPPPIGSPPELHFLILSFTITCGDMEFAFVATTDTPVHLTLHLANEEPRMRRIPFTVRGADAVASSLTCFVEEDTYDQQEAGDTLTHTFIIPIVAYCHFQWFYLTGTHAGAPSLSISQIFKVHCAEPIIPPSSRICYSVQKGTFPYNYTLGTCIKISEAFRHNQAFTPTKVKLWLGKPGTHPPWVRAQVQLWTIAGGITPGTLIASSDIVSTSHIGAGPTPVEFPITAPQIPANSPRAFSIWQPNSGGLPGGDNMRIFLGQSTTCPHLYGTPQMNAIMYCDFLPDYTCGCAGKTWTPITFGYHWYEIYGYT